MNDFGREMEGLFTYFVNIEPAMPRGYGWWIGEPTAQISSYDGRARTRADAMNAAIARIWVTRPDIVSACRREAALGRRYRAAQQA